MSNPIELGKINAFVARWFSLLDIHAPVRECHNLLADSGLDIRFPKCEISNLAEFDEWYDEVCHTYFDQNHIVQSVTLLSPLSDEQIKLEVVVGWQASLWRPPAAKSKRVSLDATQHWTIQRSTKNENKNENDYGMEIVAYNATAKPFDYAPGFARPDSPWILEKGISLST